MIKVAWDRVARVNVFRAFSASIFIGAACLAFAADGGTNIRVSGWVIDSACAYTKGLDKPIGVACAKGGWPTHDRHHSGCPIHTRFHRGWVGCRAQRDHSRRANRADPYVNTFDW